MANLIITHSVSHLTSRQEFEKLAETHNATEVNTQDIQKQMRDNNEIIVGKRVSSQVANKRNRIIRNLLNDGANVISTDDNLTVNKVKNLSDIARATGSTVIQVYIDTPPETLLEINETSERPLHNQKLDKLIESHYFNGKLLRFTIAENSVFITKVNSEGAKLIQNFNKILEDTFPSKSKGVISLDLDGTLVNNSHVADLAFHNGQKNFSLFEKSYAESPVNHEILELTQNFYNEGITVFAITGRSETGAAGTIEFLKKNNVPISRLIMKPEDDMRGDFEFKKAVKNELQENGTPIIHAIEDRPRVVAMWQKEGIPVTVIPYHEPTGTSDGVTPFASKNFDNLQKSGYCFACGDNTVYRIIHDYCLGD